MLYQCCENGAEASLTLDRVEVGRMLRLLSLELADAQLHRLKSLGFCEGQSLRVIRQGDRMIVELMNTRIGIDRRIAAKLLVALDATGPDGGAMDEVA